MSNDQRQAWFARMMESGLENDIFAPSDVLAHATPDVLASHLPPDLLSKVLTASLAAGSMTPERVLETVGVPNLCEHIPLHILWGCVEEIGHRSLSGVVMAPASAPGSRPVGTVAATASRPVPLATPPPPPPATPAIESRPAPPATTLGPSIPMPSIDGDAGNQGRVPPGQRFRPSSSGVGRLSATSNARRPQAQATPPSPPPAIDTAGRTDAVPRGKRGASDADFDLETFVGGKDDWKNALAVEDEQLVDWSASDEAAPPPGDDRKR
ncbi:MAG: hypothetical protein ABIY55_28450 [Kofleriaceae bacterium]